jgi:LysM repeat protein
MSSGDRSRAARASLARSLGAVATASAIGGFVSLESIEPAHGFPYSVAPGDTLTSIAERFYGRVELEKVLVVANYLEGAGPLRPGMRLEIPAVGYHRAEKGETWATIATEWFADGERAEALARANDTLPWAPLRPGAEVLVPYPLRYVVRDGDTIQSIAYRFLERRDDAIVLDRFNRLRGEMPRPGETILVPVPSLRLTDEGREAARRGLALTRSEDAGDAHDVQARADEELPALAAELRRGEWVMALARGNALLGDGSLSDDQAALVHRGLLEAYAAMGATALAASACAEWRRADPDAKLDPIDLGPKLLSACTRRTP